MCVTNPILQGRVPIRKYGTCTSKVTRTDKVAMGGTELSLDRHYSLQPTCNLHFEGLSHWAMNFIIPARTLCVGRW